MRVEKGATIVVQLRESEPEWGARGIHVRRASVDLTKILIK